MSIAARAIPAVATQIVTGKALLTVSKKQLLWIGILVYLIATAGYFLASSLAALICVRILYGVGFGLTTTTYGTLAADIIPGKRLGEGMGYFGLSTSLAMAVAPLIGIGLYNQYGFNSLVCAITGLVLLSAIIAPLIQALRSQKRDKQQPNSPQSSSNLLENFYDPSIVLPCTLLLLMSFTYGGIVCYITLYGAELHIANVGWVFLVNAAAIVLVRPFSGKLFDRKGHLAVLPLGALCLMAGLLLLSFISNMGLFLTAGVLYGMGYGILQPALQTWMFQRLRPATIASLRD